MSRPKLSEFRQLQLRYSELKDQVLALGRSKRTELLKQGILAAWCDSLQVMQLNLSLQQPCDPEDADACKLARLLQSEVQLMEQLSSQHSLSDCSKPLEQLLQPDDSLISPVTEPMAFFHCFMARPIMAEAATMTAQEVAGILQHTVHSLSISLHQLGAAPPWEKANKVQQIEGNWDRYLHTLVSLILLGRQDVVEQVHAINLETMAMQPAEAAEHQVLQTPMIVSALRLSEQQQELVAVAMSLYYELLDGIHKERQEINVQMTAAEEQQSSKASSGEEASSPSTSSSQGSERVVDSLPERQEQLHRQQDLANRLTLLLHKEYKLRMTAMSWFIGSLSFEQLSRLTVLSWPFAPRTLFIATEIMQQREKLVQQRLQVLS